jgi:hypothetical protein
MFQTPNGLEFCFWGCIWIFFWNYNLLLPIFAALVKGSHSEFLGEVDEWLKSTVC